MISDENFARLVDAVQLMQSVVTESDRRIVVLVKEIALLRSQLQVQFAVTGCLLKAISLQEGISGDAIADVLEELCSSPSDEQGQQVAEILGQLADQLRE